MNCPAKLAQWVNGGIQRRRRLNQTRVRQASLTARYVVAEPNNANKPIPNAAGAPKLVIQSMMLAAWLTAGSRSGT